MDAPTWAERLADAGGSIVFSNVSPGAAYAQDPDGHGWVYHRARSYGPGRAQLDAPEALSVTLNAAGDSAMVERFCAEVVIGRRPALGVLWCGEPDHVQHHVPLGSAEHRAALAQADRNVAHVLAAVAEAEAGGDEILLMIGSDHGHDTVTGAVDIVAELVEAGLKDLPESGEVAVAPNGSAALVYIAPEAERRTPAIEAFLRARPWVGRLFGREALGEVGHAPSQGLAFRDLAQGRRRPECAWNARPHARRGDARRQGRRPRLRAAWRSRNLGAGALPRRAGSRLRHRPPARSREQRDRPRADRAPPSRAAARRNGWLTPPGWMTPRSTRTYRRQDHADRTHRPTSSPPAPDRGRDRRRHPHQRRARARTGGAREGRRPETMRRSASTPPTPIATQARLASSRPTPKL